MNIYGPGPRSLLSQHRVPQVQPQSRQQDPGRSSSLSPWDSLLPLKGVVSLDHWWNDKIKGLHPLRSGDEISFVCVGAFMSTIGWEVSTPLHFLRRSCQENAIMNLSEWKEDKPPPSVRPHGCHTDHSSDLINARSVKKKRSLAHPKSSARRVCQTGT